MQKEFGKLSADQLRQLVALLPDLERQRNEFRKEAHVNDKARAAVADDGVWWAPLYELPFLQHLGVCLKALGLDGHLSEAAKMGDPQAQILKWVSDDKFDATPPEGFKLWNAMNVVLSLERSLEALVVFGRYLNELIAAGREGDDKSFLQAIRIDPTVVSCPSVAIRLSGAFITGDTTFIAAARRAMDGKTQKQARYLSKVRFVIQALREAGVEELSDKKLLDVFDGTLGIYKQSSMGNAAKALRKHWKASERKSTT
jgi:hypothetical protein